MNDESSEVNMVLPNGTYVRVNEDSTNLFFFILTDSVPDLFWAIRGGGGGNFGIVTSLKFKIHRWETTNILTGQLHYDLRTVDAGLKDSFSFSHIPVSLINSYNQWALTIPNKLAVYAMYVYFKAYNSHSGFM